MPGTEFHIFIATYEKEWRPQFVFLGWEGPEYDYRADCRMKTVHSEHIWIISKKNFLFILIIKSSGNLMNRGFKVVNINGFFFLCMFSS